MRGWFDKVVELVEFGWVFEKVCNNEWGEAWKKKWLLEERWRKKNGWEKDKGRVGRAGKYFHSEWNVYCFDENHSSVFVDGNDSEKVKKKMHERRGWIERKKERKDNGWCERASS